MGAGCGYRKLAGLDLKSESSIEGRGRGIGLPALRQTLFQRQVRTDKRFDLVPNGGITLDLDVGLHEESVPPGILATTEGFRFVFGTEIAEDASARWIGGANLGLAVEHAVKLIKIGGLEDVGRDYGVIFAEFGDAIDLDGKDYGNAVFFELTGEFDGFRGTPAVAKNNDAGVLFFFRRQGSIAVGMQKAKDGLMGLLAAMILEHLDVHARSVSFAEALEELDFGVHAIIVVNEAADKTDHYDGCGRGNGCSPSLGLCARPTGDERQKSNQEQDPEPGNHALHRDREATSVLMKQTRLKLRKRRRMKMVRGSGKG
jgi:hypothetical protein